jgi:hypothetical protein
MVWINLLIWHKNLHQFGGLDKEDDLVVEKLD